MTQPPNELSWAAQFRAVNAAFACREGELLSAAVSAKAEIDAAQLAKDAALAESRALQIRLEEVGTELETTRRTHGAELERLQAEMSALLGEKTELLTKHLADRAAFVEQQQALLSELTSLMKATVERQQAMASQEGAERFSSLLREVEARHAEQTQSLAALAKSTLEECNSARAAYEARSEVLLERLLTTERKASERLLEGTLQTQRETHASEVTAWRAELQAAKDAAADVSSRLASLERSSAQERLALHDIWGERETDLVTRWTARLAEAEDRAKTVGQLVLSSFQASRARDDLLQDHVRRTASLQDEIREIERQSKDLQLAHNHELSEERRAARAIERDLRSTVETSLQRIAAAETALLQEQLQSSALTLALEAVQAELGCIKSEWRWRLTHPFHIPRDAHAAIMARAQALSRNVAIPSAPPNHRTETSTKMPAHQTHNVSPAQCADDLLDLHDTRFVQVAYETILRRPADPNGLRHYVRQLREGLPKERIVSMIALSEEGRRVAASVPGLNEVVQRGKAHPPSRLGRLFRRIASYSQQPTEAALRGLANNLAAQAEEQSIRWEQVASDLASLRTDMTGQLFELQRGLRTAMDKLDAATAELEEHRSIASNAFGGSRPIPVHDLANADRDRTAAIPIDVLMKNVLQEAERFRQRQDQIRRAETS